MFVRIHDPSWLKPAKRWNNTKNRKHEAQDKEENERRKVLLMENLNEEFITIML